MRDKFCGKQRTWASQNCSDLIFKEQRSLRRRRGREVHYRIKTEIDITQPNNIKQNRSKSFTGSITHGLYWNYQIQSIGQSQAVEAAEQPMQAQMGLTTAMKSKFSRCDGVRDFLVVTEWFCELQETFEPILRLQ